ARFNEPQVWPELRMHVSGAVITSDDECGTVAQLQSFDDIEDLADCAVGGADGSARPGIVATELVLNVIGTNAMHEQKCWPIAFEQVSSDATDTIFSGQLADAEVLGAQ